MSARIGVATVSQESNTFAPGCSGIEAFSLRRGADAAAAVAGTNSEMEGALVALGRAGLTPVPLLHAWAMPGPPVDDTTFDELGRELEAALVANGPLEGLVLNLHGALVATSRADADTRLIERARAVIGAVPLVVSLDLHANVTSAMVATADAVTGYHTDPHVDMADTGARAAGFVMRLRAGEPLGSYLAKRSMIVPAEGMGTGRQPMKSLRARADARTDDAVVDVSLFPVQPWLDVPELGFGVTVTGTDPAIARGLAEDLADRAWASRGEFAVPSLESPARAIAVARHSALRPFVLADSADAPTAGACGDSAVMIGALLAHGADLESASTVVDPVAVERAWAAGAGSAVELAVGAGSDPRWSSPVTLEGEVETVGAGPYVLVGASFTGVAMSMGRFAVVRTRGLRVLVTEEPAWTADPGCWRHAGIEPDDVDVVVVKSVSDYVANFAHGAAAVTVDTPGPASPRLDRFEFERAPASLWVARTA